MDGRTKEKNEKEDEREKFWPKINHFQSENYLKWSLWKNFFASCTILKKIWLKLLFFTNDFDLKKKKSEA